MNILICFILMKICVNLHGHDPLYFVRSVSSRDASVLDFIIIIIIVIVTTTTTTTTLAIIIICFHILCLLL